MRQSEPIQNEISSSIVSNEISGWVIVLLVLFLPAALTAYLLQTQFGRWWFRLESLFLFSLIAASRC